MAQRIGVVLAGGEGRRMGGRPKGGIVLDGTTLAERAARTLRPLCGSVIVSVSHGSGNPTSSFPTVEDELPAGRGPLAGIAAAFASTGRADLVVLACDYPAVGPDLLRFLVEACREGDDIVLPVDPAGRDHPLVAYWRRSAESRIREALESRSYKVQSILASLEVRRIGPGHLGAFDPGRSLRNVNWPQDLEAFAS